MGELTHADVQELLGAYALDAVEAAEGEAIGRHLRGCAECRAEVAEHREAAATLMGGTPPPPSGVWDRIAAAVDRTPIDLETARTVHRRGPAGWTAAATAAAAIVTALLGAKVAQLDRRLERAETGGVLAAAAAAERVPSARLLSLSSPDRALSVEAVVLPDGLGYLVRDNLPPLPGGRTYQLWAVVHGERISAGVLGPDPSVTAFTVAADLGGLAITSEAAGGVPTTARAPVVFGDVERP